MRQYPFLTEFFARLQLESPRFFKKLQRIFYGLAIVAELLTGLEAFGFVWPAPIAQLVSQTGAIVLMIGGIISSLPVKEPEKLQQILKEKDGETP
jgi:hypothetical protein